MARTTFVDLTGKTFGPWTIRERVIDPGQRGAHWLCQCACGATRVLQGVNLRRGRVPRCECQPQYNFVDLTGQTFGEWHVLERAHNDLNGRTQWWCRCTCGTLSPVDAGNLTHGLSKSCGCYKRARLSEVKGTHRMTQTREYMSWRKMRERCLNPNAINYERYGARGITICEAWQSFEVFYAEMGPCPGPGYSLERRNNHLGYNKDNCVWETIQTQTRNKRNNVWLTFNGVTACLADWAITTGVKVRTLAARLKSGWTVQDALTIPVKTNQKVYHRGKRNQSHQIMQASIQLKLI